MALFDENCSLERRDLHAAKRRAAPLAERAGHRPREGVCATPREPERENTATERPPTARGGTGGSKEVSPAL